MNLSLLATKNFHTEQKTIRCAPNAGARGTIVHVSRNTQNYECSEFLESEMHQGVSGIVLNVVTILMNTASV
jgi:hypothetical protein